MGNHACSMRLSLGEYGGRNRRVTPLALASIRSRLDLWKRALSRIMTAPLGSSGRSIFSNHSLNTALLHMPVNQSGASSAPMSNAATILMRVLRLPGRVAKQRSPLGLRP